MLQIGMISIRYYGVCVALAAALGVGWLSIQRDERRPDAVELALYVLPLSFMGARLFYCLARFDFVFGEMGALFALETWNGGFLLWGAVAGGLLGARLFARRARVKTAYVLDRLACPAMLAIAVCRAAEWFTAEGRGAYLEGGFFCRFPFAVSNEYGEWQLAVFVWETLAAFVIFLLARGRKMDDGDRAGVALLLYAACQVVFESLRMDSTPRWGFVKISQVLSAVAVLVCVFVRRKKRAGNRAALCGGALVLAMAAIAGVLEGAIDKTPVPLPVCYAVMAVAMGVCVRAGLYTGKKKQ